MVNLSHLTLSESENKILELGLNYIPTPFYRDSGTIQTAVHNFTRQLSLRYFFRDSQGNTAMEKFTNKSTWEPPVTPAEIQRKLDELENCVIKAAVPPNTPHNITKTETDTIKSLKHNPELIIKPADKGCATVVMSRECYIREAERQLSNKRHYISMDGSVAPIAAAKINRVLGTLLRKGYISEKNISYLSPPDTPRNRQLYLLPKIHKCMDKWPEQDRMPPGRPIVSDCGSESYHISEYIDQFLAPLATSHGAYVKDTTDFLDKATTISIPADAMIFSMDVESLYTNIDNTAGMEAVKKAFILNKQASRPDAEILELLSISLNNNVFQFQGKFYKQIWGTAMGQKYAPNYANIFMAEWERQALNKCDKKPIIYLRYLDDIFGIWTHGREEFNKFINTLNNHQSCIKLTSETSYQEINFLDTTVFKGSRFAETGCLDSKVFFKTTDTHQLLHKSSFHPKHTFAGIIKSQIMRFNRICNNKLDFQMATKILFDSLTKRGYSRRFLRGIKSKTLRQVRNKHRTEMAGRCRGNKCLTCSTLTEFTPELPTEYNTGKLKRNDCGTCDVIYMITCYQCQLRYIGETGNNLRTRMNQHRSDILRHIDTPVANHFNSPGHNCGDVKTTILQSGPFSDSRTVEAIYRKNAESTWIHRYKTVEPLGMNKAGPAFNILPFVVPFCNQGRDIISLARDLYRELQTMYPGVYVPRFIAAYSRNKNLKDLLVSSTLK